MVDAQSDDQRWGQFVERINVDFGGPDPRKGKKSDQAHPPIHPLKLGTYIRFQILYPLENKTVLYQNSKEINSSYIQGCRSYIRGRLIMVICQN